MAPADAFVVPQHVTSGHSCELRAHQSAHFAQGSLGLSGDLAAVGGSCALQKKSYLFFAIEAGRERKQAGGQETQRTFLLSWVISRDILTSASCSVLLAWYDDAISEKNSKAGARGGADGCSVVFRWALEVGAEVVSPLRFISMNASGFCFC